MSELLIISSLDPMEEGQVFPESLPRHVTIWQPFQLPDFHTNEFIADAGAAIEGFSPLEVEAFTGDPDRFGPNNDVLVRRVNALGSGATLLTLHAVLGAIIEQYEGTIRSPQWAYNGYHPHMTYVDGRALEAGERAMLTDVELIEKTPPSRDKVVRKVWHLEEV